MTVNSSASYSGPYTADGIATAFPFAFIAASPEEVAVIRLAASGVYTEIGGYTVVTSDTGGTVTFSAAPVVGDPIYIVSAPNFLQQTTFANQSNWSPTTMNLALDRAAIRDIVLQRQIDQAILAPVGEIPAFLPSAAVRAGMFLAFDAGGNPIATPSVGGADTALRTDLAGSGGSTLIEYAGSTVKAKLDNIYGTAHGTAQTGATIPWDAVPTVSAASDGTTQWYERGLRVHGQGSFKFNYLRARYTGVVLETTGGVITDNLDGEHVFCWVGANAKTANGQVMATHIRVDAGGFITSRLNHWRLVPSAFDATATIQDIGGLSFGDLGNGRATRVYLLDIEDQTLLTTSSVCVVLNSALTKGAGNRYFIYHVGDAPSAHLGKLKLGATTAPAEVLDVAGNIYGSGYIKSTGGGIGYAPGAGGAVTQLTSKATAVTLDKLCGAITLNNAALAANTIVTFTLNNNQISADDEVRVWVKGGLASAGSYRVAAEGGSNNARTIVVENKTAGSLSEALVLGFMIHKAVIT
jgi:hypothetical protein